MQQIADRFPDISIAILFAGAARIAAINSPLTLTSADAAEAAHILGATHVVGLHTEGWEHFTETRADLETAFAGTGSLVETPPGIAVEVGGLAAGIQLRLSNRKHSDVQSPDDA